MPQQPSSPYSSIRIIVAATIIICVIVGAFLYVKIQSIKNTSNAPLNERLVILAESPPPVPGTVRDDVAQVAILTSAGDYRQAVATYESVVTNPQASVDHRARALLNMTGARYAISGKVEDYITDLEEMKKVILDKDVSLDLKVDLLNMLGSSYCRSGWQPEVFKAIYSGPVFEDFLASNDPDLSSRRLYEWSYSIQPTAKAAVRIARWYVEQPFFNKNLPKSEKDAYIQKAIKYMEEGERLQKRAAVDFQNVDQSNAYLAYWYWRAYDTGLLAWYDPANYKDKYKQAYADFFAQADKSLNVNGDENLPYAHLYFAMSLLGRDNDKEAAAAELQKLMDFMNNTPNPEISPFTNYIKNGGGSTQGFARLTSTFPEFKVFIEELKQK